MPEQSPSDALPATVKWGIVGCGDVTEAKSGPAFSRIDGSALVAVMRRSANLAADYASRHGVPRWYDDADRLIADPEVNAVYIATPPDTHKEYTLRALRAGKPVYVEKPMALTTSECVAMIDESERTGLPLLVAYYRRMLPGFIHIRGLIEDGAIGEVRMIRLVLHKPPGPTDGDRSHENWRVVPEISGGGHFVDLASHQFDYLDYLFGPVTESSGFAENKGGLYDAEDTVTATWRHETGVLGVGSWCFVSSSNDQREQAQIIGSTGIIRFSFFGDPSIYLQTEHGDRVIPVENPPHIQQPLIQAVVDHLRGGSECPSTGISGARATRVIEELLSDYYL